MPGFNAQDVSNTAWVLATRLCRHRALLEALAGQAASLPRCSPLELAATLWSFATLKFHPAPLDPAWVSSKHLPHLPGFDPQSLASIAWSFATLAWRDQRFISAVAEAASLQAFNSQDLANTAWAFAAVEMGNHPFLKAVAQISIRKVRSFRREEVEMLIWSLARWHWEEALQVLTCAEKVHRLRPLGLSPLLCEAERRQGTSDLLKSSALKPLRAAAQGLSALLSTHAQHLESLELCRGSSFALARAVADGQAPGDSRAGGWARRSKPLMALDFVLQGVPAGHPDQVLAALERFGLQVLRPARQWFKIAGGAKAQVVEEALSLAPAGACLEIGTYVGFTAIRCAARRPSRVVSIEVEPEHAVVAQCLAFHAGLGHQVDVWTGQSGDVLPSLNDRYGGAAPRFALVFMDQCGSRFWQDLEMLIRQDLLLPGAVILADNVLKPGAPLFLWQLFHGSRSLFTSRLISLEEFAMPGVEDCMALAVYQPSDDIGQGEVPPEVLDLEFQARRVRQRAEAAPGGVPFEEWSSFSSRMKKSLQQLDIPLGTDDGIPREANLC